MTDKAKFNFEEFEKRMREKLARGGKPQLSRLQRFRQAGRQIIRPRIR